MNNFVLAMRGASFSLLRGSVVPRQPQSLFQSSVLLFFEVKGNGFRFPMHVFIANLVLSLLVALLLLYLYIEVMIISPYAEPRFPAKLYCSSFLEGSLLVELDAQLIHLVGSVALIIGVIKRSKIFCYSYVACSMVSFGISTVIRIAQVFLCETKLSPKMLPLKDRPDLPEYFKLILMWLVCQLFWYWLVCSFVVAQLEWFKTLPVTGDEVAIKKRDISGERSLQ